MVGQTADVPVLENRTYGLAAVCACQAIDFFKNLVMQTCQFKIQRLLVKFQCPFKKLATIALDSWSVFIEFVG
jgi:hypothetical protein